MTQSDDTFDRAKEQFAEFCKTIAALRHPENGCPWDLEQDHRTLRRYMLEEAYEAVAAIDSGNSENIAEELGDVLLQVVLHAQIAKDESTFDITDVIRSINDKMLRRHPHVFDAKKDANSPERVREQWEEIKKREKKNSNQSQGVFSESEKVFPALMQAHDIGKKAAKIKFDWPKTEPVFDKLKSEISELAEELKQSEFKPSSTVREELGDVFFSLVQLCRHLDYDPETVALDGNRKFLRRFQSVEELAKNKGIEISKASQNELEDLWNEVKSSE